MFSVFSIIIRSTKCQSRVSDSRANGVEPDRELVEASKHHLGFLTLLLHTEIKDGALLGIVSSYLSALVRLLKLEGPDSFQIQVLQDSLLVALSVFMANVSTKPLSESHYGSIWNLASFARKRNMVASCTPCNNPWYSQYHFISPWQLLSHNTYLRVIDHATRLLVTNPGTFFVMCWLQLSTTTWKKKKSNLRYWFPQFFAER
jgi:hypothetical protein